MLAGAEQVPQQPSFLTEDAAHVGIRRLEPDGLGEVSGLFVQVPVGEDSVECIAVCREPVGFQNHIQSGEIVVEEDAGKFIVDLTGHW